MQYCNTAAHYVVTITILLELIQSALSNGMFFFVLCDFEVFKITRDVLKVKSSK